MNGREFVRRARRYARANGLEWRFEPSRGKGSHGRFWVEERYTTVQYGEISRPMLFAMLRQIGINNREF